MNERIHGVVKFFNEAKGYGFITRDDGRKDVFMHASALPTGADIAEGDKVSFEVVSGAKGEKAVAIQFV